MCERSAGGEYSGYRQAAAFQGAGLHEGLSACIRGDACADGRLRGTRLSGCTCGGCRTREPRTAQGGCPELLCGPLRRMRRMTRRFYGLSHGSRGKRALRIRLSHKTQGNGELFLRSERKRGSLCDGCGRALHSGAFGAECGRKRLRLRIGGRKAFRFLPPCGKRLFGAPLRRALCQSLFPEASKEAGGFCRRRIPIKSTPEGMPAPASPLCGTACGGIGNVPGQPRGRLRCVPEAGRAAQCRKSRSGIGKAGHTDRGADYRI